MVVHYHVGDGYSVPILSHWMAEPHYIQNTLATRGGCTFTIYIAWKQELLPNNDEEIDVLAFKLGNANTYLKSITPIEMMFADRAVRSCVKALQDVIGADT